MVLPSFNLHGNSRIRCVTTSEFSMFHPFYWKPIMVYENSLFFFFFYELHVIIFFTPILIIPKETIRGEHYRLLTEVEVSTPAYSSTYLPNPSATRHKYLLVGKLFRLHYFSHSRQVNSCGSSPSKFALCLYLYSIWGVKCSWLQLREQTFSIHSSVSLWMLRRSQVCNKSHGYP